jgi:hypothetical protein
MDLPSPPNSISSQVPYAQNCGAWRARIWDNDHEVYLGHFAEALQAGRAYDVASIKCCSRHKLERLANGQHASHVHTQNECPALPAFSLKCSPLSKVVHVAMTNGPLMVCAAQRVKQSSALPAVTRASVLKYVIG